MTYGAVESGGSPPPQNGHVTPEETMELTPELGVPRESNVVSLAAALAERERERTEAQEAAVRRDAPAIYGVLLVTALIAVQWRSDTTAEFVGLSIIVSVAVFWLTHVWAEVVGRRVTGPVSRREVVEIAGAEAPMLTAALPPALMLGAARIGLMSVDQAISLALAVSIVQLFLWGLAVGRALDRGWRVALLAAAIDGALGLVLVGLKVIVVH